MKNKWRRALIHLHAQETASRGSLNVLHYKIGQIIYQIMDDEDSQRKQVVREIQALGLITDYSVSTIASWSRSAETIDRHKLPKVQRYFTAYLRLGAHCTREEKKLICDMVSNSAPVTEVVDALATRRCQCAPGVTLAESSNELLNRNLFKLRGLVCNMAKLERDDLCLGIFNSDGNAMLMIQTDSDGRVIGEVVI